MRENRKNTIGHIELFCAFLSIICGLTWRRQLFGHWRSLRGLHNNEKNLFKYIFANVQQLEIFEIYTSLQAYKIERRQSYMIELE